MTRVNISYSLGRRATDAKHCSVISSLRQIQLLFNKHFNNSFTASLAPPIPVETTTWSSVEEEKHNKTGVFLMPFQVQFTHRSLNKTVWHSQVEGLNKTGATFKASCV